MHPKNQVMAIAIKSIPVLKDANAKSFVTKANIASQKTVVVNFSSQVKSASKILEKAKMK